MSGMFVSGGAWRGNVSTGLGNRFQETGGGPVGGTGLGWLWGGLGAVVEPMQSGGSSGIAKSLLQNEAGLCKTIMQPTIGGNMFRNIFSACYFFKKMLLY